jgi:hypothetical protein
VLTSTAAVLGKLPAIPIAATIQLGSCSTTTVGCHQAPTEVSRQQFSMLQLREDGHFAHDCRQPKQSNSPRALAPMVNQQRGQQRGPTPRTGRTNYTTMDEIPTVEEVLAGMFFLTERPIIILFDSGASDDFVSSTCAKKAKLSLVESGTPYVISTPGGRVDADRIVHKASLDLAG